MGGMLLLLCVAWLALPSGAGVNISFTEKPSVAIRSCTKDELLPHSTPSSSISPEWSDPNVAEDPYGCDCSFYRARYFCPSREEGQGYRQWIPRAVSGGICNSVTRSQLLETPFPPWFKVLIYGNSHLRQVVEALMCIIPDKVKAKKVSYPEGSNKGVHKVRGEATCRYSSDPDWATLVEHHCLPEEAPGRAGQGCSDDNGEFLMTNGARVHYHFANSEKNKTIGDALSLHDHAPWSHYDAVFANSGNFPFMSEESVLISAFQLQHADVPFFWLSEYDGTGDIKGWEASSVSRFHESGARYIDIRSMTHGLRSLTKGAVESVGLDHENKVEDNSFSVERGGDPHFCLPGPPDEMALLLLKLMWAVHQEGA